MTTTIARPRRLQRGLSTLLMAMLLLAIVTVIALFAAAYAAYEQRAAGNDFRYKVAFHAAESGLGRGLSFVKANTRQMLSTTAGGWLFDGAGRRWQPCSQAKPATVVVDPCLAEPDSGVRQNMYRYVGPDVAGDGTLPLAAANASISVVAGSGASGTFQAAQRVYATLCRLDVSTGTPRCSLAPTNEGTFYVTLVSQGSIAAENATATVKQSFGTFRLLGAAPAAPLIAAGTSVALGSATIVPNPNAGGFGVPVSVWAQKAVDIGGSANFQSCHFGDWLANDHGKPPSGEDALNGVCRNCDCKDLCPGYGLISGDAKSCAVAKDKIEGEDILDANGSSEGSMQVLGTRNFPSDLFRYVFGIPNSDADKYLTDNAQPLADCSTLSATSGGLYWFKGTGTCSVSAAAIGSVLEPVVLVSNGPVALGSTTEFYGIIFVRSTAGADALTTGGNPQVYGSVILEGGAAIKGNPAIIYNRAVLQNIRNSPNFLRYGPVPGSWSDNAFNE